MLQRRSLIEPSDGHDPLLPFGHYVTHLSLAHFPPRLIATLGSDRLFRTLQRRMPNVRFLTLPRDASQSSGGQAFGFWPALRGLSWVSFGFEPLTGGRIEAAAVRRPDAGSC